MPGKSNKLHATPLAPIDPIQRTLSPEDVAAIAEVHLYTVHRWLRTGLLRGTKFGNRWRILREDAAAITGQDA